MRLPIGDSVVKYSVSEGWDLSWQNLRTGQGLRPGKCCLSWRFVKIGGRKGRYGVFRFKGFFIMKKSLGKHVFALICCLLVMSYQPLAGANTPDSGQPCNQSRFSVSILPQMELLAAVQTQTSWMKAMGPKDGYGNDYFQAVKEFMEEYKGHEAVKVCQKLQNTGFSYDAPPTFILHLGPLPDLDLVHEYSDYLVGRAGGREELEEFRVALKGLAKESRFLEFLEKWQSQMDEWAKDAGDSVDLEKVVGWWEDFAGFSAGEEYHVILCPSTFGGSYGPRIYDEEKAQWVSYNIACAYPGEGAPDFGAHLERLSIHEIGHSFINPSFEPFAQDLDRIFPLYKKVEPIMKKQAYAKVGTFLNEQVLRAAQAIAEVDLYGPERKGQIIALEESRGFYLTAFVAEQLEDYLLSRDIYPKFTDFTPVLFERLQQEAGKTQPDTAKTYVVLLSIAGLGACFVFLAYHLRKRAKQ